MQTNPDPQFLDTQEPSETAPWLERARWRQANQNWLSESFSYALDILEAMEEQGLSQADLASKLGVSRQSVHQYLSGKQNFTLKLKHRIQDALGIQFAPLVKAPDGSLRRASTAGFSFRFAPQAWPKREFPPLSQQALDETASAHVSEIGSADSSTFTGTDAAELETAA